MKPQQIFIGGPASAGTTLVAILLNKHPDIWCGEEASIFDRPAIFKMTADRLSALMRVESYNELDQSMPYTITIVNPQPMSYCGLASWRWEGVFIQDRGKFIEALETIDPLNAIQGLFEHTIEKAGKEIWAEKSPGNVFTMGHLKKAFPHSKRIVVVRNPYDCIMSLCFHRNFSLNNAVMRWLVSMDAALDAVNKEGAYLVSYDRLVSGDPMTVDTEVDNLFIELGFSLEEDEHQDIKDLITGDHNTWNLYKDQLGDGALEVIRRTVVGAWETYAYELGIDEGDFTFPNREEENE